MDGKVQEVDDRQTRRPGKGWKGSGLHQGFIVIFVFAVSVMTHQKYDLREYLKMSHQCLHCSPQRTEWNQKQETIPIWRGVKSQNPNLKQAFLEQRKFEETTKHKKCVKIDTRSF